jgi:hypothetical protein
LNAASDRQLPSTFSENDRLNHFHLIRIERDALVDPGQGLPGDATPTRLLRFLAPARSVGPQANSR